MRKITLCFLAFILLTLPSLADEGMWIPMLLKKYNIEDMQKAGFKLTAEDIYDINQASLKDAVIGLGNEGSPFHHFCTGEIVSDQGLVITNHHCSFGMIQAHSSLEHNYLRDGFWAQSMAEELVNPKITASILVRMEDVTDKINAGLNAGMSESERTKKVNEICRKLESEAVKGTNLAANIKRILTGINIFFPCLKSSGMFVWWEHRILLSVNSVGIRITGLGRVTREIFPFYEFMQDRTMNRQQYPIRTCLINRLNSLKFRHGGCKKVILQWSSAIPGRQTST